MSEAIPINAATSADANSTANAAPGTAKPKTDEKVAQHGKRAMLVACIFMALVIGGLLVDSIFNARKPVVAPKVEERAASTTADPFADFEAKQRDEMARLEAERKKKAKQQAIASPELAASAPPRTPEQELRELARLEDIKRALGALKSPDMIATSSKRNDGRNEGRNGSGADATSAGGTSPAEATLAQLKQAIGRARAGGGGGAGGGGNGGGSRGGDESTAAFSRDMQGADASAAVVGQAATARRERGEGQRRGEMLLPVGSVLSAVLDLEVSSDWEGRWRALLTRDVYDATREFILLPKGTRILGTTTRSKPVNEAINERMALAARWAVLPNGARIDLSRTGTLDASGVGGLEGDVNRHFLAQLGGVAAYGVIGGFGAVAAVKAAGGKDAAQISLGNSAGSEIAGGLVEIGKRVAARYLNLVPTIIVKPGTAMTIFLDDELYLLPWAPVDESFSASSMRTSSR
jgi:type IV secretory pathway VirB10-like protein